METIKAAGDEDVTTAIITIIDKEWAEVFKNDRIVHDDPGPFIFIILPW